MIFEIISGGEKLTGWGKNGPAYFFPGERIGVLDEFKIFYDF